MQEPHDTHIGLVLFPTDSTFWYIVMYGARERAAELGVRLSVISAGSLADQAAAIDRLVDERADAVIIAAIQPRGLGAHMRKASDAGIPVVALDSEILDGPVRATVRSDNIRGAELAAAYLFNCLGGQGKVAHLQGPLTTQIGAHRSQGMHQVLSRYQGIEVVFEGAGDWSRQEGARLMRAALALAPDVQAVFAGNDHMALGALDALAAAGQTSQTFVIGFDALPEALTAIHAGRLSATVRRLPRSLGRAAVETAVGLLTGAKLPAQVLLDDMALVTTDNLAEAMLDAMTLLPDVLDAFVKSGEEQQRLQLEIITSQHQTIHALSEQKRAEEAIYFQARLLDAAEQAMLATDLDGTIIYWNRFAETLFGWTSLEAIGRNAALLSVDQSPEQTALLTEFVRNGGRWSGEVTLRRRDGTVLPALTTNSPIHDALGTLIGGVSVVVDISDRKRAEEQRMAIERKLMETQKLESLGVLAGGIAHDFNNLLVAILGNASLALMELSPEAPARTSVAQIEQAAQRAADLTRQMLAYAGKGRFVIQRLSMNAIVEEMTHLLHVSIPKNVTLRYNFMPQIPTVEADATQIRQVVMNLVVNAADAIGMRNGLITITTGIMQADQAYLAETYLAPDLAEGSYMYIEVSDTGSGMDADTRAKIFEPFFTTKFTGRGLGLAAVLGIVRGHNGALKVYSELERGSTFKFLLPAIDAPATPHAAAVPRQDDWRGQGSVLVVDDEPGVRAVATRMLARFGFTVLDAQDGAAGVELLRANSDAITCVLLDMTMPRMSGEETFRLMRQIKPSVRVLLMSGYNEQEAISHFAGKGLAGFVAKPFTATDLRAKLQQMTEM
ncbi:MAG: substrate-binding domain-containing protein [Roseiflexaceae bacterium]